MRFLFLLIAITQLLAVNAGHGLDLYDTEAWVEGGGNKVRHHKIQPDAAQQAVEPANEEGFSL